MQNSQEIIESLIGLQQGKSTNSNPQSRTLIQLWLVQAWVDDMLQFTPLGNDILREYHEKNEADTLSSEMETKILRILEEHRREEEEIRSILGIPEYKHQWKLGNYILSLPKKRRLGTLMTMKEFFGTIRLIRAAFETPTTNKIIIDKSSVDDATKKAVLYALENYDEIITGKATKGKRVIVDLTGLSKLDLGLYRGASDSKLIFSILWYVAFWASNKLLNTRKHLHANSRSAPVLLKDEVDELDLKKPTPVNPSRSIIKLWNSIATNWLDQLTDALHDKYHITVEGSLFSKLESIPMFTFASIPNTITYPWLRVVSFDKDNIPLDIEQILWMRSTLTQTKLGVLRLAQALLDMKWVTIPWVQKPKHIVEILERTPWKKEITEVEIVRYVIKNMTYLSRHTLVEILTICRKFWLHDFSDDFWKTVSESNPAFDEFAPLHRKLISMYEPGNYLPSFPEKSGELLTIPSQYFALDISNIWLSKEVDEIFNKLEINGKVVYTDASGYTSTGWASQYVGYHERVRKALANALMRWEVPDGLKNYSLVSIEIGKSKSKVESFFAFMMWESEWDSTNWDSIQTIFWKIVRYNPDTIIIMSLPQDKMNGKRIAELIDYIESLGLKLILESPESIPGIDAIVHSHPISLEELDERLVKEIPKIREYTWVSVPKDVLRKGTTIVSRLRKPGSDPLSIVLEALQNGINSTKARKESTLTNQDFAAALSFVLKTTSADWALEKLAMLEPLPRILKWPIVWQDEVIDDFTLKVEMHVSGWWSPDKPLAILFPGPTWVGKTLIADVMNQYLNFPLLVIDCSTYSEKHSVARLTSSPPWYVGSDKNGILTGFMKKHDFWIVFIDEFDKAHPAVRTTLMNFADKWSMTAGDGEILTRPQYIIMVATNAWAQKLRKDMSKAEIVDCIGVAFKDEDWKARPELASRFVISPMLAIEEVHFRKAIRQNLLELSHRQVMISHGITITHADESIVDTIFEAIKETCQKSDEGWKMGFTQSGWNRYNWFYNLRQIIYAIDSFVAPHVIPRVIREQLPEWDYQIVRDTAWKITLEKTSSEEAV